MLSTLLPFLGACLLVAMSPGPSTVLIIRNSLRSRRAGQMTVLGNETGVFIWGVVAAFGLTALLAASQLAYDVLRFGGAAVLIVFGVQALRTARRGGGFEASDDEGDPDPRRQGKAEREHIPGRRAYRAGLLLNLANPKAAIFAMSFLPQFVPQGAPQLPLMVTLAAAWAVFEVGYYSLYVWFVGRLRRVLSRRRVRRRLEQVSGGVLVALGVRLALEG
ncbi:LysE family translocator [Streptomyces ovatisporus]|uniref:LysE family translocator n=1 Tax=Streptomyces ovatisporus TaxID=1128682 RepID=A0ABV9ADH2_9ACTN